MLLALSGKVRCLFLGFIRETAPNGCRQLFREDCGMLLECVWASKQVEDRCVSCHSCCGTPMFSYFHGPQDTSLLGRHGGSQTRELSDL